MIIEDGAAWAGTEQSYRHICACSEKIVSQLKPDAAGAMAFFGGDTDGEVRYKVTSNGTAIIPVKGPMVNRNIPQGFAEFLGITTYPSLRQQFASALADSNVKRVLLDVNSGGGAVSGLAETVEMLGELGKQKPIFAYASDNICSAAYWLASAASEVAMASHGVAGSIGVLAVHLSEKRAAEAEGYDPVVLRAGNRKQLAHRLEAFSDEARAEVQRELDFFHSQFQAAVSEHRRWSFDKTLQVSDGRVFFGQEALSAGLVDKITTFSEYLQSIESKTQAASHHFNQPVIGGRTAQHEDIDMDMEQALARIAELEASQATAEEAKVAAESKLAAAEANNTALSSALASAEKDRESFGQLLNSSINTMAVAMGVEVLIPEDLAAKQAYHAQLQAKFDAKFPSGGVAIGQSAADSQSTTVPDWVHNVVKG